MSPRFSSRTVVALAAAAGLLVVASQAEAHARLVSATPLANSTGPAPKQVTLHFSEALVPKFSGFDLMKGNGSKVAVAAKVAPKDRKTLVGVVSGRLAPGTYMIMWHMAAADDGHRTKGDFNFTVR
jgi:methionine-rich copper-binding protein CopC